MEALKYLIHFFLKIAVAFFLFAFVWWVMSLFFPSLNFRTLIPSFSNATTTPGQPKKDWLPSPKQYSALFKNKGFQNEYGNVYVPAAPYNGYGLTNETYKYTQTSYVTYTTSGTAVTSGGTYNEKTGVVEKDQPATTASKPFFVRNLSIYEKGRVYTGLSFVGEARSTMFREGKFPIVMLDSGRRVIGISTAYATADWTVAGWTRFQTKIEYPLPKNMMCTLLFEEALTQAERTRQPVRIPMAVQCN